MDRRATSTLGRARGVVRSSRRLGGASRGCCAARTAIIELLRVLERRWDQRRRAASVAHDLRRLAGWFADCADDDEAHRLFGVAFGLWPARHAHLSSVDGEARDVRRSWSETTPVEVAPSLRTSGSLSNRGRVRPIADPSALRAARQREQAESLMAHRAIRAALATDGAVRLSHFDRLPARVFSELLDLLAVGLDAEISPTAHDERCRWTAGRSCWTTAAEEWHARTGSGVLRPRPCGHDLRWASRAAAGGAPRQAAAMLPGGWSPVRSDVLATDLAAERSGRTPAVRWPMLSPGQPEGFRVVRHHDWLIAWFTTRAAGAHR